MNRWPSLGLLVVFVGFTFACGGGDPTVRVMSPYNTTLGMSGLQVRANGGAWVTTDADGFAALDGASVPYDLDIVQRYETTVRNRDMPDPVAATFRDLWRRIDVEDEELVMEVDEYGSIDDPGCVVSGRVDLAAGERAFFDISHVKFGSGVWATETAEFEENLRTVIQAPKVGVYALTGVLDADGAFFETISKAGRVAVDVPAGRCGTLANVDVPLEAVDTYDIAVGYDSPDVAGVGQISGFAQVVFDDMPGAALGVGGVFRAQADGTFTPRMPSGFGQGWVGVSAFGDSRVVDGDASDPSAYWRYFQTQSPFAFHSVRVEDGATAASLAPPTPTVLLGPEDGATLESSTLFRWEAVADVARYDFDFQCTFVGRSGGNLHFHFDTPTTQVELPAFVLEEVQPGMRCAWSVGYALGTDGDKRSAYSVERWVKDPR
ncbi:MAG: hypothetical protein RIT81_30770 [Deltaproteobacteria bacterium]